MADLEALKGKYSSVLQLIKKRGVRLDHVHIQDEKLFLQGAAPNVDVKNQVWNAIKACDPSYGDLTCDLSVDESLPQPAPDPVIYTVVAGDSLWKIAAKFLGNGSHYPKIIAANPGKLKDEHSVIHPGDKLVIPPAE
ncbi:MAG: LysM peptidoglycan-binding domain-containing protein [Acidobacteria bacterium]|nr:LysM peptidoglycan-binding domain-containing protein [Acidobacteriota bacterium]